MSDLENEIIEIQVGDKKVVLDPKNLVFTESTLTQFLERSPALSDYYGRQLANAETLLSVAKDESELIFSHLFDKYKETGSSDKRAESQARSEQVCVDARKRVVEAESVVKILKQHLRAFDRAHENALSLGYNLRSQMKKLDNRVYEERDYATELAAIMGKDNLASKISE